MDKNILLKIALNLSDKDLLKLCQCSKKISIWNNDDFWRAKILQLISTDVSKSVIPDPRKVYKQIISKEDMEDAIKRGNIHRVKYLVRQGFDLHRDEDFFMYLSIDCQHFDIITYFVESDFRLSTLTRNLPYACRHGHLKTVKYLVENGALINNDCLTIAVNFGHLRLVRYLIEHGAKITVEDLNISIENGYINIEKYLRSKLSKKRGAYDFRYK